MEITNTKKFEDAIVVGVASDRQHRKQATEYLDELVLLSQTAGPIVKHRIIQERNRIDPATYIGSGKSKEIGELVNSDNIDVVIFDDDLTAVQVRNLEKHIKCKILDRSGLILDIFASRAKSKEAMTQVELAQLQYFLPRLTRQWTHLSKQYGGVGTKGPGETQIESDRRAIRTRISHLKARLEEISREREVQRKGRKEYTRIALVGYTNAGKSTLLKFLSGADVLIENRLFATLDTTVRKVALSSHLNVLLSDTVGFIRKLPPQLIASFKSTLAEAAEADILLHLIDIGNPHFEEQIGVVNSTLEQIGASAKPTIPVFNKIDTLSDRNILRQYQRQYPDGIFISANRGINVQALKTKLIELIEADTTEHLFTVAQKDYSIIAKLHEYAEIVSTKYEGNNLRVRFRMNNKNLERLKKLLGAKFSSRFVRWESKNQRKTKST